MFTVVVTEIESTVVHAQVAGVKRLEMTVDRIDMRALTALLNDPPPPAPPPRKRRKDVGVSKA